MKIGKEMKMKLGKEIKMKIGKEVVCSALYERKEKAKILASKFHFRSILRDN